MATTFADEIKWWKSRASEFDAKRATLQPLSYSYASKAYASRGNYNGAASLDSMRLSIYRQGEADRAANAERMRSAKYTKPLTKSEQAALDKKKAAAEKAAKYQLASSEDVSSLDDQVQRLQDKIKGVGGNAVRTIGSGLMGILDVISRTTYATQNIRMGEVKEAKGEGSAGGSDITFMEHLEIALTPFKFFGPGLAYTGARAALGDEQSIRQFSDATQGITGKKKTTGIDVLRQEYPDWAKEHNVAANVLGFASDIATDPLSYLTVGSGTVVKTAGAGGAKLLGKHATSKALLDQTVWTKTGRIEGKKALKQQIKQSQLKAPAKSYKKADKAAARVTKKLNKAEKARTNPTRAKPISDQEFDALKKKWGYAEAHRLNALNDFNATQAQIFEDALVGRAAAARYIIKHPFKAGGAFGQGVRTGGMATKAAKEAQAVVDSVKAEAKADWLSAASQATPTGDAGAIRLFWLNNTGKTIAYGAQRKIFKVSDDYEQFVDDIVEKIWQFKPVTELGKQASRGRSSVLGAMKKDQMEFINKLMDSGNLRFLKDYQTDVLRGGSPLKRAGATAATAAKAAPTPAEAKATAPAAAPAAAAAPAPTPAAKATTTAEEAADINARASIPDPLQRIQDIQTDQVLRRIAESVELRQEVFPALLAQRPPEGVATDVMTGITEGAAAVREYYKRVAAEALNRADIKTSVEGDIISDQSRAFGDFAIHGKNKINTTAGKNRMIAEALSEAAHNTVREAALSGLMNDPEIIVKSIVESTDEILNNVSADTHVQVLEFMRYKFGMAMPSMNLPLHHVDTMFETKVDGFPLLYQGITSEKGFVNPQYVEHHFRQYLDDTLVKAIDWEVLNDVDIVEVLGPPASAMNPDWDALANFYMAALDPEDELVGVITRLIGAARELHNLHYGQTTPGIDKYTMLDHLMWGKGPTEELDIVKKVKDPKDVKGNRGRIGRAAQYREQVVNTNGIPSFSPEILSDLTELKKIRREELARHVGDEPALDEAHQFFEDLKYVLVRPDLVRKSGGQDIWEEGFSLDPKEMLSSLGTHLGLLHDTSFHQNFSVRWRRDLASNLWGLPASKQRDAAAWTATRGDMYPEVWSSAGLMSELNEALSVGILQKTLVERMTPEQAAEWWGRKIQENPAIENILREANLDGVSGGSVGAGLSGDGARMAAATPNPAPKATATKMTEAQVRPNTPAEAVAISNAEDVADAAATARQAAGDPATIKRSGKPGGNAAPILDPQIIDLVNKFIDDTYGSVDALSLAKLQADMRSGLRTQMLMYDAKMQEGLSNIKITNPNTIRFMGIPMGSLPSINHPMHSYAGIMAMEKHQPRGAFFPSFFSNPNGSVRFERLEKYRRPSSRLDTGINEIRTSVSSQSLAELELIQSEIKASARLFKTKAERKAAIKEYFNPGSTRLDPRMEQTTKRFNDLSNLVHEQALFDTGKELADDHAYIKASVGAIFNGLPSEFRISPESITAYMNTVDIDNVQIFSPEWFIGLSNWLSANNKSSHRLAKDHLQSVNIGNLEYAMQASAAKIRISNETSDKMFSQFGMALDRSVVRIFNSTEGTAPEDKLVMVKDRFAGKNVPEMHKDRYVTEGMAVEMEKMLNFLETAQQYDQNDVNLGIMRRINNYWKAGVTIFSVRYHTGNVMSDGFMNLIDGVRPVAYKKAMAVMRSDPTVAERYQDPVIINAMMEKATDVPEDLADLQSAAKYFENKTAESTISTIMVQGKPYQITAAEYQDKYRYYSLDQNQAIGNLKQSGSTATSGARGALAAALDGARKASSTREDYFRYAHFISAVEEEAKIPGRTIEEIYQAARARVIKYHFDYEDVSEFERQWVGRYTAFYKWQRNIVPLTFQMFYSNPKAITWPTALDRARSEAAFPTQEDADGNEIPLDMVVPRWVGEQAMMPLETYLDLEGNPQVRYSVTNLPFTQGAARWLMPMVDATTDPETPLGQKAKDVGTAAISSAGTAMNPGWKSVVAGMTGKTPGPGGDAWDQDWTQPLIGMLMPGIANEVNSYIKDAKQGKPVNWWEQAGIIRATETTEGNKKGELRQQEDRLRAILSKQEKAWLSKTYPGLDPTSEEARDLVHDHYVSIGILKK